MLFLQLCLGGLENIHSHKNERRREAGLPPLTEDTHEVCRHMRASSPPASAADLIEQQQPRRSFRNPRKVRFCYYTRPSRQVFLYVTENKQMMM